MTLDRGRIRLAVSLALALAMVALGGALTGCPGPTVPGGELQGPTPSTGSGMATDMVGKIKDAVVRIEVEMQTPDGTYGSSGTGFAVTNNGRIVTCAHVVDGTIETDGGETLVATNPKVTVIFHSGTEQAETLPATIVRQNDDLDLALLKVDRETPVFLALADSDKVVETTQVMACGHPLGLEEISIREGTVSAHRIYEGAKLIEHTVPIDQGNSGGPIVDKEGRVVGVNSWAMVSALMGTKFAVPSNVVREWLASDPSSDPKPVKPGATIEQLLTDADLNYTGGKDGVFELPYDTDVSVFVHQVGELMRLVVYMGDLASGDGPLALHFNYTDPLGRLALDEDGELCWEAQIPLSFVTPKYLRMAADAAATQAERWTEVRQGKEAGDPDFLYPGGDDEALFEKLGNIIAASDLKYEKEENSFKIPYDNDINVNVGVWRGVSYFNSFTGGLPGTGDEGQDKAARQLLARNYNDPLGRLSLDEYNDVVWEVQIPMDYLTADYVSIVASVGSAQAEDYLKEFGRVPFNEKSE